MAKLLKSDNMSKCIGCFTCMFICAGVNKQDHSIEKSCIKIKTYGGLSGKFVETVCQGCKEPACAEKCPTGALAPRNGGGVKIDEGKCIGCCRCESACMLGAVDFDEDTGKPIICKHCGMCARYCPHGCLTMQDVPDSPREGRQ